MTCVFDSPSLHDLCAGGGCRLEREISRFPPRGRTAGARGFARAARKPGLTQKPFANLLDVGEATVSHWETGAQIQQRAMDRFLRLAATNDVAWRADGNCLAG
jgi:hypothetical protein